jgi:hypothetical protein
LCQNGGLSVLSSIGETEESKVGGGRQSFCFCKKKILMRKQMRWCSVLMQQSVFVAKVRREVFAHFHAVAAKRPSTMKNWLFSLRRRIICEQSPWSQRKWLACSWLCPSLVSPFSISVSLDMPFRNLCTAYPECLSNHCQRLRRTFPEICTKFDAVPLSNPLWNCIRSDIRLQIKGRKNQNFHPAAWNVHWLHCMLVLTSTVALRHCSSYTDGSMSTGSYGHSLVYLYLSAYLWFI